MSISVVITTNYIKQILDSTCNNIDSLLRDLNIPKLSEVQRTSCEGLISKEECKKAIEMFENGKPRAMMEYLLSSINKCGTVWEIN